MSASTERPLFFRDHTTCLTGALLHGRLDLRAEFRFEFVDVKNFSGSLDATETISRGGSAGIVLNPESGHTHEFTSNVRGCSSDAVASLAEVAA